MKIAIFAYSDKGCILAKKLGTLYDQSECFSIDKFANVYNMTSISNTKDIIGEVFELYTAIIFVGASGIAVRSIAPYIKDKTTDPAVIVIDECGKFVIPILSGHIGGANVLANKIAKELEAVPVITTATDSNGKFSVDEWATQNEFLITDRKMAKEISAAILTKNIALQSDFNINSNLANGLTLQDHSEIGIYLTYQTIRPFQRTMRLVPKVLVVGIGCRKNVKKEVIRELFLEVLKEYQLDEKAIGKITSIDIKNQEQGLLDFAQEYCLPITFYSAKQLEEIEGHFTTSDFVKTITGVDNVCERSACLGANSKNIIVKKTAKNGVTISIAMKEREVSF